MHWYLYTHVYSFSELYDKYYKEVYPAKLVFVSFLRSQHATGCMVPQLQNLGYKPIQFKLEGSRPDLTKLDKLFGLLTTDTKDFEEQLKEMQDLIQGQGIAEVFEKMEVKDVDLTNMAAPL